MKFVHYPSLVVHHSTSLRMACPWVCLTVKSNSYSTSTMSATKGSSPSIEFDVQVLCDSGICGVQWSPSRPTILYVLSERGQLGCLDIISQMFSPISEVQSKGSVTHFQVGNCLCFCTAANNTHIMMCTLSSKWLPVLQVVVHTMLEGDGKLNKQLLVIVYDDATVDCCLLQQHLVSLLPAEHSQIRKVLKL